MNPQYWTTDEAYKAGYEDGRKEAEDRLDALQRVADLVAPYIEDIGDPMLEDAMSALDEPAQKREE